MIVSRRLPRVVMALLAVSVALVLVGGGLVVDRALKNSQEQGTRVDRLLDGQHEMNAELDAARADIAALREQLLAQDIAPVVPSGGSSAPRSTAPTPPPTRPPGTTTPTTPPQPTCTTLPIIGCI